jgi:hypothetical protein
MRSLYQERAIEWLCRAFDARRDMTAEACLDQAMNCLRMAALTDADGAVSATSPAPSASPDRDAQARDTGSATTG